MNHFTCIGFDIQNDNDINNYVNMINDQATKSYDVKQGFYIEYHDSSQAFLSLAVDKNNEYILNPGFKGKTSRKVAVISGYPYEDAPLDGNVYAWNNPKEKDDDGDYPFLFNLNLYQKYNKLSLPQRTIINLTAFAHDEVVFFTGEDEFDKYIAKKYDNNYGSNSFTPVGLFVEEGEQMSPYAMFGAIIKEVNINTNSYTKMKFYHFVGDAYGGLIDIVCPIDICEEEVQVGQIIFGFFYLNGRFMDLSNLKYKGFFNSLF